MLPIKWYHYQWLWVTSKVTFVVWNLSSHSSRNVVFSLKYVYTWIGRPTYLVICTVFSKLQYFASSHAVTYTHIWVTVQDGIILITKHLIVIYVLSNIANSNDLAWHSRSLTYCKPFQTCVFRIQLCSSWQDFNWHGALRGLRATAELLVLLYWDSVNCTKA